MRKRLLQWAITMIATVVPTLSASAQIPAGYYSSLKGKKGAELKTAVYNIIKKANVLSYGSGNNSTWTGFWDTDRTSDGYFIDRYSAQSKWVKSTSKGAAGKGMNIEHSFPKSYWGGSKRQAYEDLYNLMPCESNINTTKSNYPMGEVVSGDKGNGWTKVGVGNDGKTYWEPADPWKGDFARGYMYMATTYQDYTWTSTTPGSPFQILETGTYPTLKPSAYKLYIKWAKADKPDEIEIKRNEAVSKIQGNRNPYVDFPNLMEYVWGDSTDVEFDPATTVKSTDYQGGGTDPDQPTDPDQEQTILTVNYTSDKGGCVENIVKNESTYTNIWLQGTKYGWKATAYQSKKNYAAEATLTMPEIDLTDYRTATLTINQAINFAKGKALDYLSVEATVTDPTSGNVTTTKLSDFAVPAEDSWTFADYSLDLTPYCGKKVKISYRYTSDANICCTWEIKRVTVTGKKQTTGITSPALSADDANIDFSKPYDLYTIEGKRIQQGDAYQGIVIVKQNGKVRKCIKR